MDGFFCIWHYHDGGTFSAFWSNVGQVHQQIDDLLQGDRKVEKIEIRVEHKERDRYA